MKLMLCLLAVTLTGCASIPAHCYKRAAIASGAAAVGGYALSQASMRKTRTLETTVTMYGDLINTVVVHKTGALYENKGSVALGTGVAAAAMSLSACR